MDSKECAVERMLLKGERTISVMIFVMILPTHSVVAAREDLPSVLSPSR